MDRSGLLAAILGFAGAVCAFAILGPGSRGVLAGAFAAGAITLSIVDFRENLFPQMLLLGALLSGIAFHAAYGPSIFDALGGAAVAYAGLWVVRRFGGRETDNPADKGQARVAAVIGAWVGLSAIPAVAMIAFAAAVLALFPLMLLGRVGGRTPVPIASLLAVGGLCALFSPALSPFVLGTFGY
jgi:leader peptidase (prepilin peptidase)/N-methyltransferase